MVGFFVPDKLDMLDSLLPQGFPFVQRGLALPDALDGLRKIQFY
jgi:hypothetical protein